MFNNVITRKQSYEINNSTRRQDVEAVPAKSAHGGDAMWSVRGTITGFFTAFRSFQNDNPLMRLLLIIGTLLVCSFLGCDAEHEISPKLASNYNAPAYSAAQPLVKLYIHDYQSRVVYVGEEFEIKVVLYEMPQLLVATSMELILGSNIAVLGVEYDLSDAGYFAKKESTLTVSLKYPDVAQTRIAFVKTYLNGTTPNVQGAGVLFKVRCKAVAKTNGYISLSPSNVIFWQMTQAGVVGTSTNQVQFTPGIESVSLQIRDDLFVP
ncbi:MAG: hypothetical protein EPO24_15330 [Bacteroidetes bacterium]|nr:MAG: hypothetical protein EPO24_15330 [Bacteroidota bacterium]